MSEPDHPCLHEWGRAAAARMPSTEDTYGRDGSRDGRGDFIVGVFFVIGTLLRNGSFYDIGYFWDLGCFHFVQLTFDIC